MAAMNEGSSAMAAAFNDSFNDDTFYAPPEIFVDNDVLKRGMKNFVSPTGWCIRFVVHMRTTRCRRVYEPHRRYSAGPEAIKRYRHWRALCLFKVASPRR